MPETTMPPRKDGRRTGQKAAAGAVVGALLRWYAQHGRHELPWRCTREPYEILVSELMLQQTQVARVIPKYAAFLRAYPTLAALAKAPREDVLRHWQGLGYNNRAVRLHALARMLEGKPLPEDPEALRRLPGIGPYTAGAVVIFAHDRPAVSVDVNVARVLGRVFWPAQEHAPKQAIDALAGQLIAAAGRPHDWQSALMDLGSAVCTARDPDCAACPLREQCLTHGPKPAAQASRPQSRFEGSTRWWRGQILKTLLRGPVRSAHLLHRIKARPDADDEDRFAAALAGMTAEGLVEERRGTTRLRNA